MDMLKRLKLLLLAPFIITTFSLTPALVLADCTNPATTAQAIQCGADNTAGVPGSADPSTKIDSTIANIVNIISLVVGVAAVIMIIVGGFRFITSGGNQESVKSAKNTILYAAIGLIVVALAQIVVRFVINQST
jgi:cytochrome bd-type quinol oxidase subunit 2